MAYSTFVMYNMVIVLIPLILLAGSVTGEQASERADSVVKSISGNDFHQFKSQKTVTVLYFYKKEVARLKQFLKEYEKSANLMTPYGVKFGFFDCTKDHITAYCDAPDSENNVYIYRDGMELLHLTLETMFDVNSIVSNVLQIVLLREVPILQTPTEVQQFEQENKGVADILFSHQRAIGTYEHRILMEVAFAYHGRYKFALTTEDVVVESFPRYDRRELSSIWMLKCKEAKIDKACKRVKYIDTMDLMSFARYIRVLDIPITHDVAQGGNYNPFGENGMHTVYVFYDIESKDQVLLESESLAELYRGIIGILLINVDILDAEKYGFQSEWKVPALAIKLRGEIDMQVMDPATDLPDMFVYNAVSKLSPPSEPAEVISPHSMPSAEPETQAEDAEDPNDISLVEKQDDQVAEAVSRLKNKPIAREHVPALTDKTFAAAITEHDFVVVVFYLTFDARSMAFLRSSSEASLALHAEGLHPLAGVDCFDWTDVCAANNITSYPTVRVYRRGHAAQDYMGLLSAKALLSAIKLYMVDGLLLLTSTEQANMFLDGALPAGIGDVTDISVLGLQSSSNKKDIDKFKELSEQMHGKIVFGMAVDDVAKQLSSRFTTKPPSIVVYKRHDAYQPFQVVSTELSSSLLTQAVLDASLPVFPELTHLNFPAYFAKKQPFVIYFTKDQSSTTFKTLVAMARSKDFPIVVFSWMDLSSKDGISSKILAEYLTHPTDDELVMVSHQLGTIHYFDDAVADQPSVSKWISDSLNGNRAPISVLEENEWKPKNKGYDFLKFIDNDARGMGAVLEDRSEIDIANEHGIGFDKDGAPRDEDAEAMLARDEAVGHGGDGQDDPEGEIREELHNLRNSRLFHTVDKSRSRQPGSGREETRHVHAGSDQVAAREPNQDLGHTEL